jgi:hypothetical protein
LDALEIVVRDMEAAFNAANLPNPPLTFAFGTVQREEMQAFPSIAWDELDGDITEQTGTTIAPAGSIGLMQPRCAVVVWFGTRELARNASSLLITAAKSVPADHGSIVFERYAIPAGAKEHASHGFQFHLEARVSIPVPKDPPGVTTDVIVEGHEFTVNIDVDPDADETVAAGARPLPP